MPKLKSGILASINKDASGKITLTTKKFEINARKKGVNRVTVNISFEIDGAEIVDDDKIEIKDIKDTQAYFALKDKSSDIANSGNFDIRLKDLDPKKDQLSMNILFESDFYITGGGKVGGAGV